MIRISRYRRVSLGKKIGTVNTSTNSGGANVNGRSDEPAEARKNTVIAPPGVANRQNINSQLVFRERDHNGSRRHRGAQASQARFTAGSIRFAAVLAILSLSLYNFFLYLARDDIPTSESLLLALIFIAVAVLCARKNKGLLHQIFKIFKQKLGFSKNKQKPVQWFIGESKNDQKHQSIVLEGVGFYINGDFYEGEFHKGRCNGSGVYNYFVNGRYEGDWIEGKYDGFGIESWATWVSAGKD